ncbi:hypothetical protein MHH70_16285 [Metasolibacillus sp. FSL H7-0170]|uniref:hypothetical protein n=1 Tax=Metasolibacillus sp. FSL H7-0170 TaxID=2921431 RepID=UPI003158116B
MTTFINPLKHELFTYDNVQNIFKQRYFSSTTLRIPAKELFGRSAAQVNARKDIQEHWRLSALSTAEFVRTIDERYNSYLLNIASDREMVLYRKNLLNELNSLASQQTDCLTNDSINIRFDGEIGDKACLFLIELPATLIEKFIDYIRAGKYYSDLPYVDLTDLITFYNNPNTSPFTNFNLSNYRYIYIPYNDLIIH